jgi:hypothetical protein
MRQPSPSRAVLHPYVLPTPFRSPSTPPTKYADSPAAALMGQKLFFDPRLSGLIQSGTQQEGNPPELRLRMRRGQVEPLVII